MNVPGVRMSVDCILLRILPAGERMLAGLPADLWASRLA